MNPVINARIQKKFDNISSTLRRLYNITDKINKTPNKIKFFKIISTFLFVETTLRDLLDFFCETLEVLLLLAFDLFFGIIRLNKLSF